MHPLCINTNLNIFGGGHGFSSKGYGLIIRKENLSSCGGPFRSMGLSLLMGQTEGKALVSGYGQDMA